MMAVDVKTASDNQEWGNLHLGTQRLRSGIKIHQSAPSPLAQKKANYIRPLRPSVRMIAEHREVQPIAG